MPNDCSSVLPLSEEGKARGMSLSYTPPKLVPPFRFATVEVGVYRGAYPTLKVPPARPARARGRRAPVTPLCALRRPLTPAPVRAGC